LAADPVQRVDHGTAAGRAAGNPPEKVMNHPEVGLGKVMTSL